MKRADITPGLSYAVRSLGKVTQGIARATGNNSVCMTLGAGFFWVGYQSVLMPWPEYEAQQKAKAERDRAVREERHRHAQLVEAQIDEQWAVNLQLQELRGELAARGVENYKHSSHGVTLSWADLAKVLGMKAP